MGEQRSTDVPSKQFNQLTQQRNEHFAFLWYLSIPPYQHRNAYFINVTTGGFRFFVIGNGFKMFCVIFYILLCLVTVVYRNPLKCFFLQVDFERSFQHLVHFKGIGILQIN